MLETADTLENPGSVWLLFSDNFDKFWIKNKNDLHFLDK